MTITISCFINLFSDLQPIYFFFAQNTTNVTATIIIISIAFVRCTETLISPRPLLFICTRAVSSLSFRSKPFPLPFWPIDSKLTSRPQSRLTTAIMVVVVVVAENKNLATYLRIYCPPPQNSCNVLPPSNWRMEHPHLALALPPSLSPSGKHVCLQFLI